MYMLNFIKKKKKNEIIRIKPIVLIEMLGHKIVFTCIIKMGKNYCTVNIFIFFLLKVSPFAKRIPSIC